MQAETLGSFLGGAGYTVGYDYQYGVADRANGLLSAVQFVDASTYSNVLGYDDRGRLASASYRSFTPIDYAYVPDSNLVDTLTQSTGGGAFAYKRDYDYETDSNRLETVKHAWSTTASRQVETRLTHNSRGLRETEKTKGTDLMAALARPADGVHADYLYTDRYEVDTSGRSELDAAWDVGAALSGTGRDCDYDCIGNRTADHVGSYSPNAINAYANTPYDGGATLAYDANGNVLTHGSRTFDYDGENRLIKVINGGTTVSFEYDYLGRRISKSVSGGFETRYVYDGWNLIAELNSSNGILRKYVWGLDVAELAGAGLPRHSSPGATAGGVGGLLMIEDGASQYYPIYDASHNVIGLYDQNGTTVAGYEYDPFGNVTAQGGSYAATNPFRFSTKYTDAETGLIYYGLRFYDPEIGRFLNRDPIEEAGGINLYGFCGNDGVNNFDYLGMEDSPFWWHNAPSADDPFSGTIWINPTVFWEAEKEYLDEATGQRYFNGYVSFGMTTGAPSQTDEDGNVVMAPFTVSTINVQIPVEFALARSQAASFGSWALAELKGGFGPVLDRFNDAGAGLLSSAGGVMAEWAGSSGYGSIYQAGRDIQEYGNSSLGYFAKRGWYNSNRWDARLSQGLTDAVIILMPGAGGLRVANTTRIVSAAEKTPLLLTQGSRVPNAGAVIRSFIQETDQVYYRVFSSNQRGAFLTAVKPRSPAFAREALALQPGNTATFIQDVLVPAGTRLQRSRALPAFGRRGGAEQFELLDPIPNQYFGPGAPFQ